MATFKKFEDIQAWQKGRAAAKKVFSVTNKGDCAKDFTLRDQIMRSVISIMANIAGGHGRRTSAEFGNFLNIARGSATETQSRLYVALDLNYLDRGEFHRNIRNARRSVENDHFTRAVFTEDK
jgi:four helix bundle protein